MARPNNTSSTVGPLAPSYRYGNTHSAARSDSELSSTVVPLLTHWLASPCAYDFVSLALPVQLSAGATFASFEQTAALTALSFCRPLVAPGLHPINTDGSTTVVFAFGDGNTFVRHPDANRKVSVCTRVPVIVCQGVHMTGPTPPPFSPVHCRVK